MISEQIAQFCKNYEDIENYQDAVNDKENTWHCHHRLELHPDNSVRFTVESLKKLDLYYNRPASELIFLKSEVHLSMHNKHKEWTDEQREHQSNSMKDAWKKHSTRRRVRETRRLKRENGENLVNIEQMASDEAYRDYQREYKRIYYKRPEKYAAWKIYTQIQRLKKKSFDELEVLRSKHIKNGHIEWADRVSEAIKLKTEDMQGE